MGSMREEILWQFRFFSQLYHDTPWATFPSRQVVHEHAMYGSGFAIRPKLNPLWSPHFLRFAEAHQTHHWPAIEFPTRLRQRFNEVFFLQLYQL
jgi:hypothetical protein